MVSSEVVSFFQLPTIVEDKEKKNKKRSSNYQNLKKTILMPTTVSKNFQNLHKYGQWSYNLIYAMKMLQLIIF